MAGRALDGARRDLGGFLGLLAVDGVYAGRPQKLVPEEGREPELGRDSFLKALSVLPAVYLFGFCHLVWVFGTSRGGPGGFLESKLRYFIVELGRERVMRGIKTCFALFALLTAGHLAVTIAAGIVYASEGSRYSHVIIGLGMTTEFLAKNSMCGCLAQLMLVQFLHLAVLKKVATETVGPSVPHDITKYELSYQRRKFDRSQSKAHVRAIEKVCLHIRDTTFQTWWPFGLAVLLLVIFEIVSIVNVINGQRTWVDWGNAAGFMIPLLILLLIPAAISSQLQTLPRRAEMMEWNTEDLPMFTSYIRALELATPGYSVLGAVIDLRLLDQIATLVGSLISVGITNRPGSKT